MGLCIYCAGTGLTSVADGERPCPLGHRVPQDPEKFRRVAELRAAGERIKFIWTKGLTRRRPGR